MKTLVAALLVCGSAGVAMGDTITLRAGADGTGGIDDVTMDDTWVETWNTEFKSSSESMNASHSARIILMGWADLFSIAPPTSGTDTIVIDNATLDVWTHFPGDPPANGEAFRMTTDWLLNAAGTNESNVNGGFSDSANSTTWASGSLSSDDWTEVNKASYAIPSTSATQFSIDLTAIMQDIYDSGNNQGIAILPTDANTNTMQIRSSENGFDSSTRPTLTLDYHYEPIPEPATLSLLGVGAALCLVRRKRA